MKKLSLLAIIILVLLVTGCTKEITNLKIDDSNAFMSVVTFTEIGAGKVTRYTFKEGLGQATLTTEKIVYGPLGANADKVTTKTVNARMSDITREGNRLSFKINGIRYVYTP